MSVQHAHYTHLTCCALSMVAIMIVIPIRMLRLMQLHSDADEDEDAGYRDDDMMVVAVVVVAVVKFNTDTICCVAESLLSAIQTTDVRTLMSRRPEDRLSSYY